MPKRVEPRLISRPFAVFLRGKGIFVEIAQHKIEIENRVGNFNI